MMTDEQIDAVFAAMPKGAQGFLVDWGYRQFARAVIEAAGIDFEAQQERFNFVHAFCRDAQDLGARYGWALHAISVLELDNADELRRIAREALRGAGVPMAERNEPPNVRANPDKEAR